MAKKPSKRADNGSNGATGNAAPVGRPYFLSLSLENVRCFAEKQTLRLHDEQGRPARWTIILGNNGTGKTTLLRALAIASIPALPMQLFEHFQRSPDAIGALNLELVYQGTIGGVPSNLVRSSSLSYRVEPSKRGPLPATSLQISVNDIEVPRPDSYGYSAGRRLAPTTITRPDLDDPVANLFNDAIPLRNAEEWLLELDYSASKESPIQARQVQRLEQVRQLLLHILPEVDDIRFSVPSEQHPTPRVEFQTPYGWVHLRALGYGYQTLIAWMVDLASRLVERYPDSPDPLAEPAVVLVDEIDLHLHPQWQRKLIDHLTRCFPNAQFIVTAHSPLVVQAAGDANVVLLRREGDHVVIDNDVQSVRGWRIDQIYTSELFGLPTARPPEVEALLERRRKLLEKPKLSAKDKKEIAELEEKIGDLPAGESAAHVESMRTIEESLELIKKHLEAKP